MSSVTVTSTVPPSSTLYVAAPKLTVTAGTSSSVMVTVDAAIIPAVTPSGSVPKVSFTLSSSSSTSSAVALKVKLFSVSVAAKVRLSGTPE